MQSVNLEHEMHCIRRLIELGLLRKIDKDQLGVQDDSLIAVLCADGHQFDDTYHHLAGVVSTEHIHPMTQNGGAILMSGLLPGRRQLYGDVLLESVLEATEVKETDDIFLYTHFPCAIAKIGGIGVVDQAQYLMFAKKRLRGVKDKLRVKCFFHVADGSGRKRTYFLPREMWGNQEIVASARREFADMLSHPRPRQ